MLVIPFNAVRPLSLSNNVILSTLDVAQLVDVFRLIATTVEASMKTEDASNNAVKLDFSPHGSGSIVVELCPDAGVTLTRIVFDWANPVSANFSAAAFVVL